MQKFLAAAIGFFSLTPGLSVFSVRVVGIQPLVILLLVYAILVPARNGRMRIQSLIWAGYASGRVAQSGWSAGEAKPAGCDPLAP